MVFFKGIDFCKGINVFTGTVKGIFKGDVLEVNTNFINYMDIII